LTPPSSDPAPGIASTTAKRLGRASWPIAQTAVAAGLAWYLTRDVLGHVQPFFAPIAAAVCLWVTNAVRALLAVEMVVGVSLGIGLGTGVQAWLGTGSIAITAVVLLSLYLVLVIGQGFLPQRPMFVNQTTTSAILVLVFPRGGLGVERLYDALIGGGLAVVFSLLLFPKNPLTVLRDAGTDVVAALRQVLVQVDDLAGGSLPSAPDWMLTGAEQLHRRLARLSEARSMAGQLVRVAPRRWKLRDAVGMADRQAARLTLLTSSVLHLAHTVTTAANTGEQLSPPLRAAISDLATAGAALAAGDHAAAGYVASVRRHAAAPRLAAHATAQQAVIAAVIDICADELHQVMDLGPR
jgi:uncharacterized membrane protein YgaE (UPF0421/DUF939 family)